MSLDDLDADLTDITGDLGDSIDVALDRETRTELAMLTAGLEPDEPGELVRRAVHAFFQQQVDTGRLDLQLRAKYDVTYDEYLFQPLEDTYNGPSVDRGDTDDRRYQF